MKPQAANDDDLFDPFAELEFTPTAFLDAEGRPKPGSPVFVIGAPDHASQMEAYAIQNANPMIEPRTAGELLELALFASLKAVRNMRVVVPVVEDVRVLENGVPTMKKQFRRENGKVVRKVQEFEWDKDWGRTRKREALGQLDFIVKLEVGAKCREVGLTPGLNEKKLEGLRTSFFQGTPLSVPADSAQPQTEPKETAMVTTEAAPPVSA